MIFSVTLCRLNRMTRRSVQYFGQCNSCLIGQVLKEITSSYKNFLRNFYFFMVVDKLIFQGIRNER